MQEEGTNKALIPCAVRLLGIEQKVAYPALKGSASQEEDEWKEWE